jgi:hypothetical protein
VAAPRPGWAVGVGVLRAPSVPIERDRRLFSFVAV